MDEETSEEAIYAALAPRMRSTLALHKLDLYRQIRAIEELDEAQPKELVRRGTAIVPLQIGSATIWATDEQRDAYRVSVNQCEWRAYIGEIGARLNEELADGRKM